MAFKMLSAEIGWLAPNGDYYPCVSGTLATHREIAHEIITDDYGLDPDNLPVDPEDDDERMTLGLKTYRTYGFLFKRGFVRVDTESIEPEEGLTFQQLVTLSKICRLNTVRHSINTERIQQLLDRHNLT